jgi:hypothetical protein
MGVFTNGKIFGIKIFILNEDDFKQQILLQKIYDREITYEEMKEVRLFYDNLEESDKTKCLMAFFTETFTTHNLNNCSSFMMWHKFNKEKFLSTFV